MTLYDLFIVSIAIPLSLFGLMALIILWAYIIGEILHDWRR